MTKLSSIDRVGDYRALAAQWLRAVRGRRSQQAFSRRLGYGSNIAYRWESGICLPNAARAFWAVNRLGGNVAQSLSQFYSSTPEWLGRVDPCTAKGIACVLEDHRAKTSILELSQRTGLSRFSISRWLNGKTAPPLDEFFQLLEATSLRLLDFIATFTNPATLECIAPSWSRLVEARETAYTKP